MKNKVISDLEMNRLFFDKIKFERIGLRTEGEEGEFEYEIEVDIKKKRDDEEYMVTIILEGEKPDEYELRVELVGIFTLHHPKQYSEELKDRIISRNTVAIMLPFLRSQITLLTSQPEVAPEVLPVLNVNNFE